MPQPKAYSYLRMSTDMQLKGDSRRRQLQASKAYADENNLDLAEEDQLEDIGISAYKGANVKDGALGKFLAAVKDGTVQRGSYLIVESLDRLSREDILRAHTLFLGIVQSGVNLVTLTDKRVYRAETTNLIDMITSLVIMERAHEESKTKGLRVGAAWKNKRALAQTGKPMTARCPAWLRLSPDRSTYDVIPERVEIVRQIFADTVAGIGMYTVATRLNQSGISAFQGKNGWHRSYIAKTLENRAVLGEFQPCVKIDGKRIPDGDPIVGYYPPIVSDELFFQAHHSKTQRRAGGTGAGRKGPGFTNLFTGIARCAYCDSAMAFENKGAGKKDWTYLVCGSAQRGRGCQKVRWNYSDFETSFLAFVQELDLDTIIDTNEEASKRKTLEEEVSAIRGELTSVVELMNKTYELLAADAATDFVAAKLTELSKKQTDLTARLDFKEAEYAELLTKQSRFLTSREEISGLVKQLQGPPSAERYKLRAQVAARLRTLVETLYLAPLGSKPRMERTIKELRELSAGENSEDVIEYMVQQAEHPDQSRRYFAVGFRDAAVRVVFPTYNDPLRYEMQIEANKDNSYSLQTPALAE